MEQKKRVRKGHLVTRIILISVSIATLIGIVLTTFAIKEVKDAYHSMNEELLQTAEYQMNEKMNTEYDGDWSYDEEQGILKGGVAVYDEYIGQLEDTKEHTGLEYTLFWTDFRVCTTVRKENGEYTLGDKAGDAVIEAVLKRGENYFTDNITIGGSKYYGYYGPVTNSDGSIVGMAFAGKAKSKIDATITRVTVTMIILAVVLLGALMVVGFFLAHKTRVAMDAITSAVENVANGILTRDVPESLLVRTDELGTICESVNDLIHRLREVIGTSKKLSMDVSASGDDLSRSASQASAASNQVTEAVDDISKGAVGQAESVQDSAQNVSEIGGDIDTISGNVETLSGNTQDMKTACANSMAALENLLSQNAGVVSSMGVIDHQIRNTNDAVQNISEATKLITDIASQTNLLALNASIEAARAGEAGKGFAVVATEIGGLAEQSRQATVEINDIVKQLIEESQKSVETIELLNQEFEEQSKQIEATKADMERMEIGVNSVADSAGEISGRVVNLDSSKGNLVSIIEDLSAVSQENAAATQETTASMEELNATFELISHSAEDLKGLAAQLDEQISFFTLND